MSGMFKNWDIHTMECYSAMKRNKLLVLYNNLDEATDIFAEEKKRQIQKIIYCTNL